MSHPIAGAPARARTRTSAARPAPRPPTIPRRCCWRTRSCAALARSRPSRWCAQRPTRWSRSGARSGGVEDALAPRARAATSPAQRFGAAFDRGAPRAAGPIRLLPALVDALGEQRRRRALGGRAPAGRARAALHGEVLPLLRGPRARGRERRWCAAWPPSRCASSRPTGPRRPRCCSSPPATRTSACAALPPPRWPRCRIRPASVAQHLLGALRSDPDAAIAPPGCAARSARSARAGRLHFQHDAAAQLEAAALPRRGRRPAPGRRARAHATARRRGEPEGSMRRADFYREARRDRRGRSRDLRVVELTTTWAGPMGGCMLADFGADVIKVEHPRGEIARRSPPFLPGPSRRSRSCTRRVNRNKRSLALDLHDARGARDPAAAGGAHRRRDRELPARRARRLGLRLRGAARDEARRRATSRSAASASTGPQRTSARATTRWRRPRAASCR